jgi:putative phage-type endonuclease
VKVVALQQRSPAWRAWRDKGVGSSDAAILWHGRHFGRTVTDLWREKVGLKGPSKPVNPAMRTGTELEPDIRRWYETTVGFAAEPLCAEHEVYPWLRGSLDGWVAHAGVVVEIKYARKDYHAEALAGRVPEA